MMGVSGEANSVPLLTSCTRKGCRALSVPGNRQCQRASFRGLRAILLYGAGLGVLGSGESTG